MRQVKNLSVPELADAAGISKGYLWQLENGRDPNPSLAVLSKIAKALDTTVADLLGQPRVRAKQHIPETLPRGLKEFLDEQRRKGAPIREDIVRALAQLQARSSSKEDWEFLYGMIQRSIKHGDA
jgi:transcriptional regulator with XRE-family HTH domain